MLFLPSRGSGEAQRKQHRNPDNTSAMPHPTFSGVGWGMALRQHCIGESDSPGPHRRGVSALDSVASTSQAYGLSSNDSSLDTSPAWELAGTAQNIHRQADDYRLSIYEAPFREQALQLPHLIDFPSMRPRSRNRPYSYPISIFPLYSHKATTTAMGS